MENLDSIKEKIKGVIKYNNVSKLNLLKSYLASCIINKNYDFICIIINKNEPLYGDMIISDYLAKKNKYMIDRRETYYIDSLNECINDINKIIENQDIEKWILNASSLFVHFYK